MKLIDDFKESLILEQKDLIKDYLELGVDGLSNNELIKQIPIVKTLTGVINISSYLKEQNLMKNMQLFITELNSGKINEKKLAKYKNKLDNNPKYAKKELGRMLILLDKTIDEDKAIIFGKIFKSFVNCEITWEEVIEFTEITDRLFIYDISLLKILWKNNYKEYEENREDAFRIERIYSLGILGHVIPSANNIYHLHGMILNKLGKRYCNIILNND